MNEPVQKSLEEVMSFHLNQPLSFKSKIFNMAVTLFEGALVTHVTCTYYYNYKTLSIITCK